MLSILKKEKKTTLIIILSLLLCFSLYFNVFLKLFPQIITAGKTKYIIYATASRFCTENLEATCEELITGMEINGNLKDEYIKNT